MGSSGTTELSKSVFLGFNTFLFSLCVVAFAARIYIRWVCFRRLLIEDWLMVAALCMLIGCEALCQVFADDIYNEMAFQNGDSSVFLADPGLFLTNMESMLKACGSGIILFIVGFYFVKANFLVFFYRLGSPSIRVFCVLWWVVFSVVMICGVASVTMGVPTFKCLFDGIFYTLGTCETKEYENKFFTYFRASVALDVITDALIIGFPIWLLWGVRISFRKKLALGAIFSLVGFTIAATILRGALLSEVFQTTVNNSSTFNIPWVWFWFNIELCTAFIVACLVSFRALFVHRERATSGAARRAAEAQRPRSSYFPSSGRTPQQSGNGSKGNLGMFRGRVKVFQDSILDTCRTLEGVFDDDDTLVGLEMPDTQRRSQPLTGGGDGNNRAEQGERRHDHDQISISDNDDLEQGMGGITDQATSATPWRPSTSTSHQILAPSYEGSGGHHQTRSRDPSSDGYPEEPSPMSSSDHISISQLSQDSLMVEDAEEVREAEPSPLTPNPVYQGTRWGPN